MNEIAGKPIVLDAGGHAPGDGKACVMEWTHVHWMVEHGCTLTEAWTSLNDSPACTDPLVYRAAQKVNDRVLAGLEGEAQLAMSDRIAPFVPRLARCHTPADPVKARRVRVRVSCWAARQVLHLIDNPDHRTIALTAIQTAEAWLRGEASEEDCRTAYDASTSAYAYAAIAIASAAAAAASAYASASASASASAYAAIADASASAYAADAIADAELIEFLDQLMDEWAKAIVEEGCALDEGPIPTQVGGS